MNGIRLQGWFKLQTNKPPLFWCPNLDFTPNYSRTPDPPKRKKTARKELGGFQEVQRETSQTLQTLQQNLSMAKILGTVDAAARLMGREHWLFG